MSIFLFVVACTKDVGVVGAGDYPADVSRIISGNCAVSGCHTPQSQEVAGGIDLSTWSSLFEGSDNGSPVIPFSTKFSSLLYFINTYPEFGLQSKPTMPLNKPPLSREQVATIRNWIEKGAPDRNGFVKWSDHPGRKKLYAVNQGCDVVMVLDAGTRLPMRAIDVGVNGGAPDVPHHVRVSPDGQYWYVIFINGSFMQKYRCSDDKYVGDIPLTPFAAGLTSDQGQNAGNWNVFVITPDGKKAFCTSLDGKISVVDLEKKRFIRWIGGQHQPHGIALNARADTIYVTAQTGNFITELDTALSSAKPIVLAGDYTESSSLDVHDILLSADGTEMWVTCQKSDEVRVIDMATKSVKKVIPTGRYPQEIVYSARHRKYYISCTADSTTVTGAHGVITAISANGGNAFTAACGYQPHGIAVDDEADELYVLSRNLTGSGVPNHHGSVCEGRNGFLNFVSLADLKVKEGSVELSVDPYYIYLRP